MGAHSTSGAPSSGGTGWSCKKMHKRSDSSSSHSPTALPERMKERLQSIAQDVYIPNKSCGEEIVPSSFARARKAAPKKGAGRGRPVKQVCSDTIEKSISSTDKVTSQRKRARIYKGSPPGTTRRIRFSTSCHTVSHSYNSTSHRIISLTPSLGLFSPAFGSKQAKQTPSMSSLVLCLCLPD